MRRLLASLYRTLNKPPRVAQVDPLNRRFTGGQLKGFSATYFKERDRILAGSILPAVFSMDPTADTDEMLEGLLRKPSLSRYDERVVEYSWILAKLARSRHSDREHLLDVGCVLNNALVAGYFPEMFEMIWFMNPSPEKLAYTRNAAYMLSDIREHKLPAKLKFDVITCLSTLEHIGMDTRRYGGPGGEVNPYPDQPQRNALDACAAMVELLKPNGRLYLSVPYGQFEYLYDFGRPKPIYYVFDKERLQDLVDSLPISPAKVFIDVYKVVPDQGWVLTSLDDDTIPFYADGCTAAGGVALIEIQGER